MSSALQPTIDPIPELVRKIAIPAGTGMFFHTLFNVVDTFYAGLISTEALAALAVSFPVFFIIVALIIGIGHGASALIANAIGGRAPDRACRLWGQALIVAVAAGAMVALYGVFAADPLFRLAGTRGEALILARTYLVPLLLFAFIFLLNAACNGLLSAQGDTRSFRDATIVGCLLNILLNPLFMFGIGPLPGLGVLGIAISTIVIQFLQFAFLWHRCRRSELGQHFELASLRPDIEAMFWLLKQTVPVTGQMLTTGVGLFAITYFMARHGEAAVAAYGVALRIEQIAMLPMVGLNTAAMTLVGQNYGANKFLRVTRAAWTSLVYGVALMILGALVVWLFRDQLMALFTADPEVVNLGGAYLNVAVLIFAAYAILMIGSGILQGMKRPVFTLVVGLFRHIFGPLVVLWLLDPVLGYGLPGIYWGIFVVAWIGALTTLLYLRYRLDEIESVSLPEAATVDRV